MVQWLRLHACTAGGAGSITGQGTKIPCHVARPKKKKRVGSNVRVIAHGQLKGSIKTVKF